MLPIVAIVGRPNTGKSTLFNRLIGRRHAVTSPIPGTTRDRIYQHCTIGKLNALLVDTGGLEYGQKENIEKDVQAQAKIAVEEAHLTIFLLDGRESLTIDDFEVANLLRKARKKVIIAANKCENINVSEPHLVEMYKLGFGEPLAVSAIHQYGIEELQKIIEKTLRKQGFKAEKLKKKEHVTAVAIVGRPNVGKSSLLNALLGEKRAIVSEIPGTTRDTVDIELKLCEKSFLLIDTAGIRRRGRIQKGLEKISVFRGLNAIERSDIVILVLDAKEGIKNQDAHVSEYVLEAQKGLILALNKIDLLKGDDEKRKVVRQIQYKFSFLPWVSIVLCSAVTGENVKKLLELAEQIHQERKKRIETSQLNTLLNSILMKRTPTTAKNIIPKIYDVAQIDIDPPRFAFFVNDPEVFHFSYIRYLENEIRKRYGFTGTPIEIILKPKEQWRAKRTTVSKGKRITKR